MEIGIDPQKLIRFAACVSDFSTKINTECSEISRASSRLSCTLEVTDLMEVQKSTRKIRSILEDADPDLEELSKKVEGYANYVSRLKSV